MKRLLILLATILGIAYSQGLAGCRVDWFGSLRARCFAEHTLARLGPLTVYGGLEAWLPQQWYGPYLGAQLVWDGTTLVVEGRGVGFTVMAFRSF